MSEKVVIAVGLVDRKKHPPKKVNPLQGGDTKPTGPSKDGRVTGAKKQVKFK